MQHSVERERRMSLKHHRHLGPLVAETVKPLSVAFNMETAFRDWRKKDKVNTWREVVRAGACFTGPQENHGHYFWSDTKPESMMGGGCVAGV